MNRHPFYWLVWLLLSLLCNVSAAEEITVPLSDGNKALADFRPGEPGKPAIFILHGFLQTSRFSTVQLITEELADNGYTVLAPTLTLNIDQRRYGLGCDAIQNHSVADGNREIADWMAWLKAQGYTRIIAIGHSSGSMQLLSYLSEQGHPPAELFIATSIGPIPNWQRPVETRQQLNAAKQRNQNHIANYTLAFCDHNYTAPASAYLSYMQWTEAWVLEQLQRSPIPVHVVLGGADTWLPPDWGDKVAEASLPLSLVNEASHNFTGPQEFEFQELILTLLEEALDRKP